MFTVSDNSRVRTCRGSSRREFLKIGSLALGGLTLPGLLRAQSEGGRSLVKGKSVVFLFLQGGPSQIELFDPKMSAPVEIRSITGEVQSRLPGVTFGGTFPRLANMADKLAVVRSFASGNADHQNYLSVASGGNAARVPMGTLYSRVAGTNHPRTGMPTNVILPPESVLQNFRFPSNFETQSLQKLVQASQNLGASYSFFDPSGGGELRQNLELRLPRERLTDRRNLLQQIDTLRSTADQTRAFDNVSAYEQQAFDLLLRGVAEAFDIGKEDPRLLGRYDTSGMFTLQDVHQWGDMRRSSNLLGKQMLLARRLCEAGCGFVTVMDAGWDMHSNNNSPRNLGGMQWLGPQVDHAVSAFLEDVEARGLSDKILLIVTGEMGRTPRIGRDGGRDHWANLTPLLLAGGGLRMGQVIGQSDRQAGTPATERYTPQHLLATVMQVMFDIAEVRLAPGLPRDVERSVTSTGTVIRELF
jgi:hypothetical protein